MIKSIPVLLYHNFRQHNNFDTLKLFSNHLNWLADNGYRALSLQEFNQILKQPETHDNLRYVLITFDDGWSGIDQKATPILERLKFKAVNFVITDKVGEPGYLDWATVVRMQNSSIWECQSHSHTHIRWQNEDSMIEDIIKSRTMLADRLSKKESYFDTLAWPWGACNEQWEKLAMEAGFTTQFLVQTAAVMPNKGTLRLPRITCDGMPLWKFISVMRSLSITFNNEPLVNSASIAYRRLRKGFGYL